MKSHRHPFVRLFGFLITLATSQAQVAGLDLWQELPEPEAALRLTAAQRPTAKREIVPTTYRTLAIRKEAMGALLSKAPAEAAAKSLADGVEILIPLPEGGYGRFRVLESPIMEPGLAAQFPEIKTYIAQGIDDPTACGRIDITPKGFRASILSEKGRFYIDPYWSNSDAVSTCYYTRDHIDVQKMANFHCGVASHGGNAASRQQKAASRPTGANLRTYRLAVAATGEYTAAVSGTTPGTVGQAQAAIVTTVNRVNTVYERDFAVRLVLVANNNNLIFTNSATDGYTNSDGLTMLSENQTKIDAIIGNANYDIGHVFSTGGGGIAGLGVVCVTGSKAEGVTGSSNPVGDSFDIDYVAHEMGHQFNCEHTFNGTSGAAAGNRNAATAHEPGSGSTIMAYAGICAPQDLQEHSDDYFHTANYTELDNFTTTGAASAAHTTTATGNSPPVIAALPSSVTSIPAQTPFALTASATDANGDALTYCWEEFDLGTAQNPISSPRDNGSSPIFRSYAPVSSPTRVFPSLQYILNNANQPPATYTISGDSYATGEVLPTTSRTMTFRVSVRDNRAGGGGQNWASMQVASVATAGPFKVNSPNSTTTLTGGTPFSVTWDVAGTTSAPISCANVKISFSKDGGNTFPIVLASSVPNNGSAVVTIPNDPANVTSTGRVRIDAVSNIFFDINDANFNVNFSPPAAGPPVVSTSSPVVGSISTALSYQIIATNSPTAFTASGLPAGLTLNATTGTISGTPTVSGTILATVTATNSFGTGQGTLTFNLAPTTAGSNFLAGWDFQTTTSGGTAALASPNTPTLFSSNVGTGTLYLNGTNGSSSWTQNNQLNSYAGSTENNAGSIFSTTTTTPACLGLIGHNTSSTNGKSLSFKVSMTGRQNLLISYAHARTSTSFTTQTWQTSTNGTTWTNHQTVTSIPSTFGTQVLNNITALDGLTDAYVRVTFTGASGTAGYTTFDNIRFVTNTTPAGPSLSLTGSASSLSALYNSLGTPSSALSLSGSNLGASVVVTAPNGFQVGKTSTGSYSTSQSFTISGGTLAATPVFVRIAPGPSVGPVSGVLSCTSTTAVHQLAIGGTVSKALLTPAFSGSNPAVYDGSPKALNAQTTPATTVNLLYTGTNGTTYPQSSSAPSQAGSYVVGATVADANYEGSATTFLTINKADQIIVFDEIPAKTTSSPPFVPSATGGGSGLPVTFTSSDPLVATTSGSTVTIVGVGVTAITAFQDGDANHNPAGQTSQILTVTAGGPTFGSLFPGVDANDTVGGVPALVAYALGGSNTGNNLPILPVPTVVSDHLRITFLARVNDPSTTVLAEGSTDLEGSWNAAVEAVAGVDQTGVPSGFERKSWRLVQAGGGFLRVRVVLSP